jgi:hypothetical protein
MSQLLPRANAGPLVGQPRNSAAAAAWPRGGLRPLVHRSVVQRQIRVCSASTGSHSNAKVRVLSWQGGFVQQLPVQRQHVKLVAAWHSAQLQQRHNAPSYINAPSWW